MDEAAIEKAGAEADRAAARHDRQGQGCEVAVRRRSPTLHTLGVGVAVRQSVRRRTRRRDDEVIVSLDQGGLGLPDRDYYLKDDEQSKKLDAYEAHVAAMLVELGRKPDVGEDGGGATIVALETELAKVTKDKVDAPRSDGHVQPARARPASRRRTEASTGRPTGRSLGLDKTEASPSPRAEVLRRASTRCSHRPSRRRGRATSRSTCSRRRRALAAEDVRRRAFKLDADAHRRQAAAWSRAGSAASQRTDGALGELLGQLFVARAVRGREQDGGRAATSHAIVAAMAAEPRRAAVDGRDARKANARRRSSAMTVPDRLSRTSGAPTTFEVERDDFGGERARARASLRDAPPAREDRQARRSQAEWHMAAADGQRVLRPAAQQHGASRPASCSRRSSVDAARSRPTSAASAWSSGTS